MKSVVSYTLAHCTKCLKCLKACPTEAIMVKDGRVNINSQKCINCGRCMEACFDQGLQAKGSTLIDIQNYDYSVALVPSAIYSACASFEEVARLTQAIKLLGFNEVVDISDIEGRLYVETKKRVETSLIKPQISTFCPVINRLIEIKYPMLVPYLLDLEYPSEIAAKQIRNQYQDKGHVGIFYLCECVSKLALAKYPYGNTESSVDHALSIVDLFPLINALRKNDGCAVDLSKEGLMSVIAQNNESEKSNFLIADGEEKITRVLDLAEFDQLSNFDCCFLYNCMNGCIGGNLLWGNPFDAKLNTSKLIKEAKKPIYDLSQEEMKIKQLSILEKDPMSIREKMQLYTKVNDVLDKLPHFDCSACGYSSCRALAEDIVLEKRTLQDCKILQSRGEDK